MITNKFLKDYYERIEKLNYRIEECIYVGAADGRLDLVEVETLFKGCINEIKGLQLKVDSLSEALRNG